MTVSMMRTGPRPAARQKWVNSSTLAWAIDVRPQMSHPTQGLIREAPYQYQAEFWADRSPTRVVLKARQTGFSQAIALEALHTALHQAGSTTLIVSRNLETAVNVLHYVKVALETPGLATPRVTKAAETQVALANRSRIISIAATRGAGRSYAASAVYLDEFAHMPWALDIYRAVAPTTSRGGRLTILSTPNGRANPFYLLWSGHWGKEFSRHLVPWYRCPAYNPAGWQIRLSATAEARRIGELGKWYKTERPKYSAADWAQEYDTDFVESGRPVFRAEDIERAEQLGTGLAPYRPEREYVTFWDIGRRNDPTVGTTLDISELPFQLVAWERHERLPYPQIQRKIEARYLAYPGRHVVESNGVGDPVIENLAVTVEPWVTSPRSKQHMIESLVLGLEGGQVGYPAGLTEIGSELLLYQWDDEKLVQDCVMSLAGAVAVAGQPAGGAGGFML